MQVCLSRLQLAAPAHSVSLVSPHIMVGLDTGAIMVYLNLGRGDLVQQQVTGGNIALLALPPPCRKCLY